MLDTTPPLSAHTSKLQRELFVRQMLSHQGADAPDSMVRGLVSATKEVTFRRGQQLFAAEEDPTAFFILQSGAIEMYGGADQPQVFSDPGDAVGALDVMIARPRSKRAIARVVSKCLRVEARDYLDMLENDVKYALAMIASLAAQLQERQRATARRLSETASTHPPMHPSAKDLELVEYLLVLRRVAAFRASPVQALVSLALEAQTRRVAPGEVLFDEGEASTSFVAIAEGQAEISLDGISRGTRTPGELIEDFAAFGHMRRQYRAVATTPMALLVLQREAVLDRMEEHFGLMRSVQMYLAACWDRYNRQVRHPPEEASELQSEDNRPNG